MFIYCVCVHPYATHVKTIAAQCALHVILDRGVAQKGMPTTRKSFRLQHDCDNMEWLEGDNGIQHEVPYYIHQAPRCTNMWQRQHPNSEIPERGWQCMHLMKLWRSSCVCICPVFCPQPELRRDPREVRRQP